MVLTLFYLFLSIIFAFAGTITAKYILSIFTGDDLRTLWGEQHFKKMLIRYLITPLFAAKFIGKPLNATSIKYKQLIPLTLIFEVLGAATFFLFMIFLLKITSSNYSVSEVVFTFCFQGLMIISLLYLAIFDTLHLAIPLRFTKFLLFIVIIVNLLVGGLRFVASLTGYHILQHIGLGGVDNLLAGTLLALLVWFIVKITREKGMGEGDIDMMMTIGLASGWPGVLVAFLCTLVIGTVISLLYASYIRKFKDVLIPFIPLALLGYLIALTFGTEIFRLIIGF